MTPPDSTRSARDVIRRERKAFARGRCAIAHELDVADERDVPCDQCQRRAMQVYPDPKPVQVPRIVSVPSHTNSTLRLSFALVGGRLKYAYGDMRQFDDSFQDLLSALHEYAFQRFPVGDIPLALDAHADLKLNGSTVPGVEEEANG